MSRTKIVATIGPSSDKPETIRRLLAAGMTVARINFSHGDHQTHEKTIRTLRRIAEEESKVLAILADLQGPKLRVGQVKSGGMLLSIGKEVIFTPHPGQPAMVHLPHPRLIAAVQPGARLVIGDGEVELTVVEKRGDEMYCLVTVAGILDSRKGIHAPGTTLPVPSITEKDKIDLKFICCHDFDYVALSFVRTAEDIRDLQKMMLAHDRKLPIIAKIEKREAIENLEEIRDVADGMMVARGDLGIEMQPQNVPMLQKKIIRCCNSVGKPVITATQMLQSMVKHPRPTRAEASDVANAILDGTDAVMLSEETATGSFPVESVKMMAQISEITEEEFPYNVWHNLRHDHIGESATVAEAISSAACDVAEQTGARVIVSATLSGYSARQIARYRPPTPIMAVSPLETTQRRLALVWGVDCLMVNDFRETDEMLAETVNVLEPYRLNPGDKIVITAGVPFGRSGLTNLIQVHNIV